MAVPKSILSVTQVLYLAGHTVRALRIAGYCQRLKLWIFFYDEVLEMMANCNSCLQCVRDDKALFMVECLIPTGN